MNVSFDKIAPPVAFVIVGLILILVGAAGVIPIGTPQPIITEPIYRAILVGLGIILTVLGPLFVWRELSQKKTTHLPSNKPIGSEKTSEIDTTNVQGFADNHISGVWEQIIFGDKAPKPPVNVIKRDIVECKQTGELVEASIARIFPEHQKGRKWHFAGRFRHDILFGHFWSDSNDHFSFGTIYLRKEEDYLKGNYVRASRYSTSWNSDVLTVEIVRLKWQRPK
ncbi:MAG: hypothetical protein HOP27_04010 [Anaerolineales bacterium]|nr:hypothetical protein [Anaerolineales bacterium]